MFGGGMRQGGFMAAAGIYALQNNIDRLKLDHDHAKQIGEAVAKSQIASAVLPIETNIIIFETHGPIADTIVEKLRSKEILCHTTAKNRVRFVLHLDITEEMVERSIEIINNI